ALAAALAGLPGEAAELAWSGAEGELALWLPGTAACPQPSPELAAAPADGTWLAAARGGGRLALRAWRVPVLSFPAAAALPLIAGLGDCATPGRLAGAGSEDTLLPVGPDGELAGLGNTPDEVVFGQSVPFLAACAALAADLAARGRLLPALTRLAAPDDAAGPSSPTPLVTSESTASSGPATASGPLPSAAPLPQASSGSAASSASAVTPSGRKAATGPAASSGSPPGAEAAGSPGPAAPSASATPSGADVLAGSAAPSGPVAVRYAARWRPVVSGADAQRVRELAQAMPPVCRATSEAGEQAAAVLASLLDSLTDAAARASLAADPGTGLLPPRRGRRPAKVSVTERWAAALTSADP